MADSFNDGLMGPQQPQLGGLMGLRDPDMLMSLGLGVMSAAKYGGNLGDGIQGALGSLAQRRLMSAQTAETQQRMSLQNLQANLLQRRLAAFDGMGSAGGAAPQDSAAPAQPSAPGTTTAGPTSLAPVTEQDIVGTSVPGVMPWQQQYLLGGMTGNPGEYQAKYREQQIAVQKQQHAAAIARMDNLIKSDHPAQYVGNSLPEFSAYWPSLAKQMSVDPETGFTDANVRRGIGMIRNPLAASLGQPEVEVPEEPENVSGEFGSAYQVQRGGTTPGKVTTVQEPKPAALTSEKVWDPATNTMVDKLVQTAPQVSAPPGFGRRNGKNKAPAPQPAGHPNASPGLGATAATIQLGPTAPSAENNKAAMFAGEFRAGNQTMAKMEGRGFQLSPAARTIAINMATEEDPGAIKQLVSQEVAAHRLTKDEQTYLAAMMPMLQAAGHDQSGARLTTAQIRQNVESLLPMGANNKPNMDQVHANREGFYTGLLTQAGPALQQPQYSNSLLADLKERQQQAGASPTKTIAGKTYYKQNGKWYLKGS